MEVQEGGGGEGGDIFTLYRQRLMFLSSDFSFDRVMALD